MDGNTFDTIVRGLSRDVPRRRVFGGMVGGLLAALGGTTASAARRRDRRRRRKSPDGVETETPEIPAALVGGVWDETIDMCIYDPEIGGFRVMPISTVAVPAYLNQGNTLYIDCCDSSECVELPCLTPTGCIEGACGYDPMEGAPCALPDGTTGVCNADADCVPGYSAPAPGSGYVAPPAQPVEGAAPVEPEYSAPTTDAGYSAPATDAGYPAAVPEPGF